LAPTNKQPVTALSESQLRARIEQLGAKPFRIKQILTRLYRHLAVSWDEFMDLPALLRDKLNDSLSPLSSYVEAVIPARDGTEKLLVRLADNEAVEAVKIPAGDRLTACVSTQVGCRRQCTFCASYAVPYIRNLAPHEMVEQAMHVARQARGKLTHVVFMGVGEPLDNLKNVLQALRRFNMKWCMNIGMRRMSLSTVGVPGKIRELAELGGQFNLAISLHAPTDELRERLIPAAGNYPLNRLIADTKYYFDKTHREITYEYLLLGGVNDSEEHARKLGELVKRVSCTVNLISYNPVKGLPFKRPSQEAVERFQATLEKHISRVTLRRSRGLDAHAACGQLRARTENKNENNGEEIAP